jgi:hypothetical protein
MFRLKARPKIQQCGRFAGIMLLANVLLLCCTVVAQAQVPRSNLVERRMPVMANKPLRLDTVSLEPGSVLIAGMDTAAYHVDYFNATLQWNTPPQGDSISIRYRRLPLNLAGRRFHKDRRQIDSVISFRYDSRQAAGSAAPFVEFNNLNYTGSYGRSLSMGNNQDAALTSNFNFQASGYLPDSIRLDAAISDNTLPFQPEGNTQRLQEFDQVYIRLTKKRQLLQLGDYNIERPKGYFLNFNKRVQGIYYGSGFRVGKRVDNSFGLSGSVAKGEFSRNIFFGQEGNQGPYKLTGNNGEQFFIVLAGTERVYINGLIQERGENADYIINYNTAEIRFMPRRLITKDSRIQIEFEYQSRNYLNSLIYAWDEVQIGKKLNLHFNLYSNQDAKNQGYQQSLNGDQKRFLGTVGDSIRNALYPVVTPDTFAAGKVLYKLIDTTVGGRFYDSVFIYSISPDSARYNLSFSYVGPNRGDYVISSRVANGKVYDWIPRSDGVPQGDYAPVQLLITPKLQQVYTLTAGYQIDSFKRLELEVAGSNYDPNLFSTIGNNQHLGLASKARYQEQRGLGAKDTTGRRTAIWKNDASYEYVQAKFRAIAPYRNVEFGRDWNVPAIQNDNKPDEHLASFSTNLEHRRFGNTGYAFGYYGRGETYSGYRNIVTYGLDRSNWRVGGTINLLNAVDTFSSSRFFRPSAVAEYRFVKLNRTLLGASFQQEDNRIRSRIQDTLRPDAYRFSILSAYLKTPETQQLRYGITYTNRSDDLPRNDQLQRQSHSHTIDAVIGVTRWKNHIVSLTGSYRRLLIDDTLFNSQKPEETGLGRIEYTGNLFKNALQLQSLYETGAGQEQKRIYTYVEVPAGQGTYTWVDYNKDGVQTANEFEIAIYQDQKRYIRIFTPSNEYLRVNYVTFNQSVSFDAAQLFRGKKPGGFSKFASKFSDQGSLQITNRLTNVGTVQAMNPFLPTLRDDRIIFAGTSLSNTAFFNRSSTVYGVDYSFLHNTNKQLLTYGVEGQGSRQHTVRLRWNITPAFNTNILTRKSLRSYQSALSDGRTYAVQALAAEPALTWMFRSVFRITGTVRYEKRHNEEAYGGEEAEIRRFDLEARYSKPVSGVLLVRGSYAGIAYNGLTTAPVAFTILDALQPGANFIWYASWDRRVTKGIELSLEYEGRRPGIGTTIHTGRMSVRAIL